VTEDEINQMRHDAANAVQRLNAVRATAARCLTELELGHSDKARHMLHTLIRALNEPDR